MVRTKLTEAIVRSDEYVAAIEKRERLRPYADLLARTGEEVAELLAIYALVKDRPAYKAVYESIYRACDEDGDDIGFFIGSEKEDGVMDVLCFPLFEQPVEGIAFVSDGTIGETTDGGMSVRHGVDVMDLLSRCSDLSGVTDGCTVVKAFIDEVVRLTEETADELRTKYMAISGEEPVLQVPPEEAAPMDEPADGDLEAHDVSVNPVDPPVPPERDDVLVLDPSGSEDGDEDVESAADSVEDGPELDVDTGTDEERRGDGTSAHDGTDGQAEAGPGDAQADGDDGHAVDKVPLRCVISVTRTEKGAVVAIPKDMVLKESVVTPMVHVSLTDNIDADKPDMYFLAPRNFVRMQGDNYEVRFENARTVTMYTGDEEVKSRMKGSNMISLYEDILAQWQARAGG